MTEHDTHDGPIRLDGDLAVATEERQQLIDLSIRALAELLGSAPETDEDGDIAIPVHGFGVYVTVAEDSPELHVWSSLLSDVDGGGNTAALVAELSEEWPRLRFSFQQGHLLVSTILDADPFAPQHLVNLIGEIHELTHEVDDDFAARFRGVLDCDADDDSYAGGCGGGGCGDGCACGHDNELGATIPVGEPEA
ncbi:T3SS (YopN, CesT) and YbjN peptide-binding chaperone 1 [Rhodococcus sp. O3]|uniref:T3SS (YopN, CesT) and YbjN peptide-binding chaperone 1 n=1 Tax=Rhodococcus sp. O3 TaxID=3404919 RepID=UPI003B671F36